MKRARSIGGWTLIALLGVWYGLAVTPNALGAEKQDWQLSSSFTYESGTYGTGTRTETVYVPFTLKRFFDVGDLSLTLPFVVLRTTGETTLIDGRPQRIRIGRRTDLAPTGTVTKEGLGDMLLKGRYYVVEEHGLLPTIALVAKVKFPTADSSQGLGTGKFDEGVGVEGSRTFLRDFIGFFDVSYTVIGSPAGLDLKNQTAYDFGLGYYFTQQLLGGLFYEERTALITGQSNPRSLLFTGDYTVSRAFRLNAAVEVGLSNGSPDYGLTGGVAVRF
jgi:hypothetical protein